MRRFQAVVWEWMGEMVKITEPAPAQIREELQRLIIKLDAEIPPKLLDRNLLIATWNLRKFHRVSTEWMGDLKLGVRDYHSIRCIAEIIRRFDVVAIQEVRGDAEAFKILLEALGNNWGFALSDINYGTLGNLERSAYLFDTRKVVLSGLIGEYVVVLDNRGTRSSLDMSSQFARAPYLASFQVGSKRFTLINMHLVYGDREATETRKEVREVAKWLERLSKEEAIWNENLIVVGDVNIRSKRDPSYKAFLSTGLHIPKELDKVRCTIFDDPVAPVRKYAQIAWFKENQEERVFSLQYTKRAGNFDFTEIALSTRNLTKQQLSFSISDFLPLWVEFSLRD